VRQLSLEQKLLMMKSGLGASLRLEELMSPSVGQAEWIFDT
jgi:hypothetical protein